MIARSALIDTNILIDVLAGEFDGLEILRRLPDHAVSIVTQIELIAGPAEQEADVRALLSTMPVLPLTAEIADTAALVRRDRRKLKLPDAIILATARVHGRLLVSRNTRDFRSDEPDVYTPYEL